MPMFHRCWTLGVFAVALLVGFGASAHAADLWTLAKKGDLAGVKAAIASGADVNGPNDHPPLCAAASEGHYDVTKLLLEHGAKLNIECALHDTPLHEAAKEGYSNIVKLLLDHGANPNAKATLGVTPLFDAARYGHTDVVKLLIAKGADVNIADYSGYTPLHSAVNNGRTDVAKLLLDLGANPNAQTKENETPLSYSAKRGYNGITKNLLRHGAKIYNKDSMLRDAASGGLLWLVKDMLTKGGNVNTKDKYGNTPIFLAASNGHSEVARFLLEQGAKIDDKISMLFAASSGGLLWLVKDMLTKGANVNTTNEGGWTPLLAAAREGRAEVVKFLLSQGADINAKTTYGQQTPLLLAAMFGHTETVKLLLEKGSNPNETDKDGDTPLHEAAKSGHIDVAKLLLAAGAEINTKPGPTPLHWAVSRASINKNHSNMVNMVKLLLENGANVDKWTYASATTGVIKDILKKAVAEQSGSINLFNTPLLLANRDVFRKAIKNAGAKPLRENNRYWFDKYDSSNILSGTDLLWVGYVLETGALAMVEYSFPARMDAHKIIDVKEMLASKYGQPDWSKGNAKVGPASFGWNKTGVEIIAKRGWPDTTVFLDFIVTDAKKQMDAEIEENKRREKKRKLQQQSNAF